MNRKQRSPFPWRVHPIWRGIGCLLLIVLPFVAYGLTDVIVAWALANNDAVASGVRANPALLSHPYFKVAFTAVLTLILFLTFSIVASLIYSIAGGPLNEEVASMTRGRKK